MHNSKMKIMSNKRGAMELSMGTLVTIVLVVVALVMGLVLIRSIFQSGTSAVDQIDSAVQDQINKLFSQEGKDVVIYPASQEISLERGDDPAGFAFSLKNKDGTTSQSYTYTVSAQGQGTITGCGSLTVEQANQFIIGGQGEFNLGPGATLSTPRLVRFDVPESAPSCSFFYNLEISGNLEQEESIQIFVTLE